MRAGASSVQQTLTPEAAAILKHAVGEALRRGHAQATPLHVAATLLGAPGSPLRRACVQTLPHSPHPLQCRALELCFSVALDRLQGAQGPPSGGQPVYSNALVAALKRAQAHQRRGYPEQQQQPLLAVKVELEQLVISILDDPSVSRVMREAGFSSPEVKNHLEDMVSLMNSHHSAAGPISSSDQGRLTLGAATMDHIGLRLSASPSFLGKPALSQQLAQYNSLTLERSDTQLRLRPPPRPPLYMNPKLHGINSLEFPTSGGEDVKRVLEVLQRRKKRNPVLVGEPGLAMDAVIGGVMHRMERGDVPEQLHGVKFVTAQLFSQSLLTSTKEEVEMKLNDLNKVVEGLMPAGTIIHVGDLQWLMESSQLKESAGSLASCLVQYAVNEIEQMLSRHADSGRLWLFGTASCQSFLLCQKHLPSLEGQWDLQPMTITLSALSLSLHSRCKSQEAMTNPVDSSLTLTSITPTVPALKLSMQNDERLEKLNCCSECMGKYEKELLLLHRQESQACSESPRSCSPSSEAPCKRTDNEILPKSMNASKPALPLWLQKAMPTMTTHELGAATANESGIPIVQKLLELRRKWNQNCQKHHSNQHLTGPNLSSEQMLQLSPSSQASGGTSADRRAHAQAISGSVKEINSCASILQQSGSVWLSTCQTRPHFPKSTSPWMGPYGRCVIGLETTQQPSVSLLRENNFNRAVGYSPVTSPSVAVNDNMFVRTDLSLGRPSMAQASGSPPRKILDPQQLANAHKERLLDQTGCSPSKVGLSGQNHTASLPITHSTDTATPSFLSKHKEHSGVSLGMFRQMDPDAFRRLCEGLAKRVSWQKEGISAIANTVLQCRSGMSKRHGVSLKGDTWLLLLGPDQLGKRRMAEALAEIIFGCEKKVVCIGLGRQNNLSSPCVWNLGLQELDGCAGFSRGRLPLDRIAEALKLNPFSVLLLEDVDQCDSVLKKNLIQAMEKGRLLDSFGREVRFSNAIVVMTSSIGTEHMDPCKDNNNSLRLTERRLAVLPELGLRLIVENAKSEKVLLDTPSSLAIVDHGRVDESPGFEQPPLSSTSKRKANWNLDEEPCGGSLQKLAKKSMGSALTLDLNVSAEESETVGCPNDCQSAYKINERQEHMIADVADEQVLNLARKHMAEFCDLVDAVVTFRPYDFETLMQSIFKILSDAFFRKVSPGSTFEIDVKAFEQIIAPVWWAPSGKEILEKWAQEILDESLSLALTTCSVSTAKIWKLLPDQGVMHGQRPAAVYLPSKISLQSSGVMNQEQTKL